MVLMDFYIAISFTDMPENLIRHIEKTHDHMVLTLQGLPLYANPELINHCLKTQKGFTNSFPGPETGRKLCDHFSPH
jgi:hypothetical protein